ncbi:MAG: MFS transporter [Alphaproteobacteria bacterium]
MPIFYGWVVVAAAFVVLLIGFGIPYSFAAFFTVLETTFGAARAEVSLVFSICGFFYFGLGVVSGPLADRYGPRRLVIFGMALVAIGVASAAFADELWQIYLGYGLLVGVGVGFAYVPAIGAIQRWFMRRRGAASGFAVAGIGVGTLAMPPLAALLIELFGWRGAYGALAGVAAVFGLGAAFLIEADPSKRGLYPDGDPAPKVAPPAGGRGRGARHAFGRSTFWVLYIATSASSLALFVPFVHLAPFATDVGLDATTGVWLFSLIGVGSVLGRFFVGGGADRIGRRRGFALMFVGMGVMQLWWLGADGVWTLAIFALFFGVFYGGFVALAPALTADYFGDRSIGAIIGMLYSSVALGTLVGPPLAGLAYDVLGSYAPVIAFGAACNAGAALIILTMPDPRPLYLKPAGGTA